MPCIKKKRDDKHNENNNDTYEEIFRELYPPHILMDIDGIKEIIEINHYQDFEYKLNEQIDNFCKNTFVYPNFSSANLQQKQVDIMAILYDNCVKKYDLEYFYNNPELAEPFIKKDLLNEKKNKKHIKKDIIIKEKKYDWTTKTYK